MNESTKRESLKALADQARRIREEINQGYRYVGTGGQWNEPEDSPGYETLELWFTMMRKST